MARNTMLFMLTLNGFVFLTASAANAPALNVPEGFEIESAKSIQFSVQNLFGTHKGIAKKVQGKMEIDKSTGRVTAGHFSVALEDMTTDNTKRDCHLRQTLGLDYSVSEYPDKHVCDSNDELPKTGPNSVRFPNVELRILAINDGQKLPLNIPSLPISSTTDGIVNVQWTIHGKQVAQEIPVKIIKTQSTKLQIQGQTKLSLKSFGAVVKPFGVIGVDDTVRVKVDVPLEITE